MLFILLLLVFVKLFYFYLFFYFSWKLFLFFHVPGCSEMFRVPGYIDRPILRPGWKIPLWLRRSKYYTKQVFTTINQP